MYVQPKELAYKMFQTIDRDCSGILFNQPVFMKLGFIDWNEFLQAMKMVKGAKTLADKIDLFINVS